MSIGGLGNTVSFGIKAIADLKGIDQTAKALTGLGTKGTAAGQGISKGMDAAARSLDASRAKADAVEHSMRGITVAAAAVVGLGVGLFKIGASFDSVLDSIQTGTGATGDALAQLGNDARAVFRSIPTDLETAGTAITELAKRTAQSGKGLQDLAAAEIELARITGGDLKNNIEVTSKLFENWGVVVEDQVAVLDELFRASQATGIPVNKLAAELTQFGPILRSMGFGLDASIALLASFDKAGVDAAQVITGLRTAIAKFSASGVTDLGAALQDVFTQIKNAPTDVSAAAIAIENFGSRAGPAFAENIRAGRLSYEDLIKVIRDGNVTIRGTADATNDAAEKFHILKNRVIDAAIPIGTQFFDAVNKGLPALETLVRGLGVIGNAFSLLPGPVKAAAAGIVLLAVGIAGITAVGARLVAIGFSTAAAWSSVAAVFTGTAVAADVAAVSMGAAGVAAESSAVGITALAVAEGEVAAASTAAAGASSALLASLAGIAALGVISVAVVLSVDFGDSLLHGGKSWVDQIAAEVGRLIAAAFDAVHLDSAADALNNRIDEAITSLDVQDQAIELGFTLDTKGFANAGDAVIEQIGITIAEAREEAAAAGLTIDQYLQQYAAVLGITKDTTAAKLQEAEADKLAAQAAADGLTVEQEKIDLTIRAKREQEDFNRTVQDTLNAQFLAGGSFDEWMRPFILGAEDAEKAAADLNQTLDEFIAEGLAVASGVQDISSELPGAQLGFRALGDIVVDVVRDMDQLDVLDLSPAVQEALDLTSALSDTEQKLQDVDSWIKNNNEDTAKWSGNISLVSSVTGANTQKLSDWQDQLESGAINQETFNGLIASLSTSGGFPKLDALLADGSLTQQQYNDAVAASVGILQRSAGGIQDERAELALNLIAEKSAQDAKDNTAAANKNLTQTQKDLNASLETDAGKDFIARLELLQSIGAPDDQITKFIIDASSVNDDVKLIAQSLGLLPGEKSVIVSADPTKFIDSLNEVKGVLVTTTGDGATIEVRAETQSAVNTFLELNKNELADLDGKELIVYVRGDGGGYVEVADEVKNDDIPDKTVNITATMPDIPGIINPFGGVATPETPAVEQPEPIVFTATDEVTPVAETVKTEILSVESLAPVDLTSQGEAAGTSFLDGMSSAVTNSAISEIFNPVSIESEMDLSPEGAVAADNFITGLSVTLANAAAASGGEGDPFAPVVTAAEIDLSAEGVLAGLTFIDGLQIGLRPKEWRVVDEKIAELFNPGADPASAIIPLFHSVLTSAENIDLSGEGTAAAASFTDSLDSGLSTGVETGFNNAEVAAQNGAAGILAALDLGQIVYNFGFNDGYNFGVGVANGITATWNSVFNAGFGIGQAAAAGTAAGMQAHSPSKIALALGANFGDSFADGLRSTFGAIHSAGQDASKLLNSAISDPSSNPAMRALLTVDSRPQAILAQSIDRERGAGNGSKSITVRQENHFHGMTQDEVVVQVSNEFNRALDRGVAAGLFGE